MAPDIDFPAEYVVISAKIIEQGLLIVSHFNGVPIKQEGGYDFRSTVSALRKAKFIFLQLMAESSFATRYAHTENKDGGSWAALLYAKGYTTLGRRATGIPTYLKEERYKSTRLAPNEACHCIVLGSLNLIGVIWFRQFISPGGFIQATPGTPLVNVPSGRFATRAKFYALLFFSVPGARLLLIVVLNFFRQQRNRRRARLVSRTLGSS